MITHDAIWSAIDRLAARYALSPSGLARAAGLDSTTFNKSKRFTANGRERWPSTESLAKVLQATGASFDEFLLLMANATPSGGVFGMAVPLLDMDLAGGEGLFDKTGLPVAGEWDEINFPDVADERIFALEVVEDDYEPLYWAGDILIISPGAELRRGDRVAVRLADGRVVLRQLLSKTGRKYSFAGLTDGRETEVIPIEDVVWVYRILWVRQ